MNQQNQDRLWEAFITLHNTFCPEVDMAEAEALIEDYLALPFEGHGYEFLEAHITGFFCAKGWESDLNAIHAAKALLAKLKGEEYVQSPEVQGALH